MKKQTWFALLSAALLSVTLLAYAGEQSPVAPTA